MEKDLYIKELESGLINALDEMARIYGKGFNYYDKLSEITNWNNTQVLDFLDKFGDNEEEDE